MADKQQSQDTAAIARRCIEDAAFAQNLIASDEYPEVRDALLADLQDNAEVQGYLNPQPLPPGPDSQRLYSSRINPAVFAQPQWSTLHFARLAALSQRRF